MGTKYTLVMLGRTIESASISAMNRAAQTAVSKTSSFIREKYNFKKSELDEKMKIIPARSVVSGVSSAIVRVYRQDIGLIHFNATQFGRAGRPRKNKGPRYSQGVKATVQKGNRQLFRSADTRRGSFIQTIHGATQVFIRTEETNAKGFAKIKKLSAFSLTQLFDTQAGKSKATDLLHNNFEEAYEKRLEHEISRRFKG